VVGSLRLVCVRACVEVVCDGSRVSCLMSQMKQRHGWLAGWLAGGLTSGLATLIREQVAPWMLL
jgi:hypothetical protein